MTPWLKGNSAGKVTAKAPMTIVIKRCPTRKGRGIVGKPPGQVVAETLGREWVLVEDRRDHKSATPS